MWSLGSRSELQAARKKLTKEIHAVTIIDDATAWPEIGQIEVKTAEHIAKKFDTL